MTFDSKNTPATNAERPDGTSAATQVSLQLAAEAVLAAGALALIASRCPRLLSGGISDLGKAAENGGVIDFGKTSGALLEERFAEIYRSARGSVGLIDSAPGSSTGFVVSKDGAFLATDHAVADGLSTVRLPSGAYQASLVGRDRNVDLALLKLHPKYDGEVFSALKIADRPARLGEKSVAAGFPVLGEIIPEYRAMSGRLFSHSSEFGDPKVHGATRWDGYFMRTKGGASGSPLLDKNGAVKGMVSFHRDFGTDSLQVNTTGAIRVPVIRRFLSQHLI